VLRTSAASTGSTAWWALAGTVVGFAIGAGLLAALGTGQVALWVALPIAVCIASYAPGTAPFLVGQAAFTVTVVVLFNLLAPAGWRVGLLRIQDVAIGCAVSLVIGILFWPRGAAALVGDDLADAFRRGSAYLTQAVDWALGLRPTEPDTAIAAVTAGIRLDDALRGFLAEQGTKRLSKNDLWQLVMSTMRLRLTAHSLAGLRGAAPPDHRPDETRLRLQRRAAELADFYGRVADQVSQAAHPGLGQRVRWPAASAAAPAAAPALEPVRLEDPAWAVATDGDGGAADVGSSPAELDVGMAESMLARNTATVAGTLPSTGPDEPEVLWVHEHLRHLRSRAQAISRPATLLAETRQQPWWR
jgi:uncharacterized membrane protein YccC